MFAGTEQEKRVTGLTKWDEAGQRKRVSWGQVVGKMVLEQEECARSLSHLSCCRDAPAYNWCYKEVFPPHLESNRGRQKLALGALSLSPAGAGSPAHGGLPSPATSHLKIDLFTPFKRRRVLPAPSSCGFPCTLCCRGGWLRTGQGT